MNVSTLTVNSALALADRIFGPNATLAHVDFLNSGRPHRWSGWSDVPLERKEQVARYLALRSRDMDLGRVLLTAVEEALDNRAAEIPFAWSANQGESTRNSRSFEYCGGRVRDEYIVDLLSSLSEARPPSIRTEQVRGALRLVARHDQLDVVYEVPSEDLPYDPGPQHTDCNRRMSPLSLSKQELLGVAARVSNALREPYHLERLEDDVLTNLEEWGGIPVGDGIALDSEGTTLFVAPTGRGKTVLIRMAALALAERGVTVALVVPDVRTVLDETRTITRMAAAIGIDAEAAPLFSSRRVFREQVRAFERAARTGRDEDRSRADWTARELGHFCRLRGYHVAGAVQPAGDEPCNSLRAEREDGGVGTRRACPFHMECPKFRPYRKAEHARILVINHHALLSGVHPDSMRGPRTSSLEFVLRKAEVLLIDEVDALQSVAIEQNTGSLLLSDLRTHRTPLRRAKDDADRAVTDGEEVHRNRPLERVRIAAEELTHLLRNEYVRWGVDGHTHDVLWEGRLDGFLARSLFPDMAPEEALDSVDRLLHRSHELDRSWSELGDAVRPFRALDITSANSAAELVSNLRSVLLGLDVRNHERVGDVLILRAGFAQLRDGLDVLRTALAPLAARGSEASRSVRDSLGGYGPWSPSPYGALNRRVYGYRYVAGAHRLEAVVLQGDPHGVIAELGDLTSLALAGTRRPVVGFSATAFFPDSPTHDVLGKRAYFLPDEEGGVTIRRSPLSERVSGAIDKGRAVFDAAKELWAMELRNHLETLKRIAPGRARALIVTSSYEQARLAAAALRDVMGDRAHVQLRYVTPSTHRGKREEPELGLGVERERLEDLLALAPEVRVLVAPRSVVARGLNILQPGTSSSAFASIYFLVRPVPPIGDVSRALAHISYNTRRDLHPHSDPVLAMNSERRYANKLFAQFRQQAGALSHLSPDMQRQVLSDALVELIQIAGRARRGGTHVNIFLADAAFHDDASTITWPELIHDALEMWRSSGSYEAMMHAHRSILSELERYAHENRPIVLDAEEMT